MSRRALARSAGTTATTVFALALAIALGACQPAAISTTGPTVTAAAGSPGATADGASAVATSPMTGVPIDIEAAGLSQVTAFTIRTNAGAEQRFLVGKLENAVDFPPGHLAEHLATSSPIRVFFRVEGSDLVAYRLEDATAP